MGIPDHTLMDGSLPDWRDRLVERVRMQQASKGTAVTSGRRKANIQVNYDIEFGQMLRAAAESRGIALGSYVRRALARQIAKDLRLDWTQLLAHCAAAQPFGSRQPGARPGVKGTTRSYDDGVGYGDWNN